MDLSYLVRAGLGIPDYWHPHLAMQPGFLSGSMDRYPISMESKADYPGPLDGEGVPVVFWGAGGTPCPSPVNIALYGLGNHDAFVRTGDENRWQKLVSVLKWLKNHSVPLGAGIGWANEQSMPAFGVTAPWFSSITQGLALSLFVRARRLDPAGPWAKLTHQTWLGFHCPVDQGGFRREVDNGVIYEEYPGPQLDCVFNGMCHALIGLWEAWRSGLVSEAQEGFVQGVKTLRHYLPMFDHHGWSLYSLTHCLGKPYLASPYYHNANALLAEIIGGMADDPEFGRYAARWKASCQSVIRRISVSLRIGLDRYRKAPSLLHSDKTKGHCGNTVTSPVLKQSDA